MGFLAWIVVGLIAGWLAGQVMKGGGYGVIVDIILGILGGVLGTVDHPEFHFRDQVGGPGQRGRGCNAQSA